MPKQDMVLTCARINCPLFYCALKITEKTLPVTLQTQESTIIAVMCNFVNHLNLITYSELLSLDSCRKA